MELLNTNSGNVHFSNEQWSDFVRGVADEVIRGEMHAHLESGCSACLATVQWLGDFARAASVERELDVPARLVQQAREIFVTAPPRPRWVDTWEIIAFELVRQATLGLQPAGVRSTAAMPVNSTDRMLFRAGDYSVDLQVESPGPLSDGEIVGQITNERDNESLDGTAVEVVVAGRAVNETVTNRFGEFVIEWPLVQHAVLRFALTHRKRRIELPISVEN